MNTTFETVGLVRDAFISPETKLLVEQKRLNLEPSTSNHITGEIYYTQALVARYLREKHNTDINIKRTHKPPKRNYVGAVYRHEDYIPLGKYFESYELCLEAGLIKALNLLR